MKLRTFILSGISAVLLACSSVQVDTDHDRAADFSRYKTFAWAPESLQPDRDDVVQNDLFNRRMEMAVRDQLARRGLSQAQDADEPDLYVSYLVRARERLSSDRWSAGAGIGLGGLNGLGFGGLGWGPGIRQYREGTLIVDLIDARTRRLVWRGVASDAIDEAGVKEEKVNEAVAEVMEEYPPRESG